MKVLVVDIGSTARYTPSRDHFALAAVTLLPPAFTDVTLTNPENCDSSQMPYGIVTPVGLVVALDDSQAIIFEYCSEPRNAKPATTESAAVTVSPCVELAIQRSKTFPAPLLETKPKIFWRAEVERSPVDNASQSRKTFVEELSNENPLIKLLRATHLSSETFTQLVRPMPVSLEKRSQ